MRFDLGQVGQVRDSEEFRTSSYRLAQFADAVGDDNAAHAAGQVAPPVFAHIPVMQLLVEQIGAVTDGFVIHGEHDFHYHRPIEPGQRLFTRSVVQEVANTKAGVRLAVRAETSTHQGDLVCVQYSGCLVQGASVPEGRGEAAPAKPAGEAGASLGERRIALPDDQAARYAEAARDYSPYTLDTEAAKAKGLPAPMLHGMCTLALAARAVVEVGCEGDSRRLKRLGCRFSHPLYLTGGQSLTTRLFDGGETRGRRILRFEAVESGGETVIKQGFAEIQP